MKKCAWCGQEYGDEITQCVVDGRPLESPGMAVPAVPAKPPILPSPAKRPGPVLLVCVAVLLGVNVAIAFARARGNLSYNLGAASSQWIIPLLVAGLFAIGRRFRQPRSLTRIFLWTSVVLLLAKGGSFLTKNGRDYYLDGVDLYNRRDYAAAAAQFSKSLEGRLTLSPSHKDVLLARASAWAQIGEDAAAIADCKAVLGIDPRDEKAMDLLAGLMKARGQTSARVAPASAWPDVLKKTSPLTARDVPALVQALTNDAVRIRLEAMDALGDLGPAAWTSLPALRKAEQDENPYVRNSAKAAITKIRAAKQNSP